MFKLLSRDEFRSQVFERDRHQCVICGLPAKDAHHILERRLWGESGGYYLTNGASLCEDHHLAAEMTTLSCEDIRLAAKIEKFPIPDHLYDSDRYDKWGNIILPTGMRIRGELFFDESVQKIMKEGNVLDLFGEYVKYCRTHHLPWSPAVNDDDRIIASLDAFKGKRVIASAKQDGENTNLYRNYLHARSIDYTHHMSRSWVRNFHAQIAHEIPDGWRMCGENLFAKHSIHYKHLKSYFYLFSIWNERNKCLSWDDTVEYAQILGMETVPVLYDGIWDEKVIRGLFKPEYNGDPCEGFVVRVAEEFDYRDFRRCVAKYVRAGHVQTHAFWLHQEIVKNELDPGLIS